MYPDNTTGYIIMINKITILSFILSLAGFACSQNPAKEPETVQYVDIKKYVGLWYEIAKIPNKFQKDCAGNTTAQYKLLDNGKLEVVNSCTETDGNRNITSGIAKVVDKTSNAKLEVSFFSILGIRPFWGDYLIIGLDENYQYAVIGAPDRKYGWILSRTPSMSKDKLDKAFEILKQQGYDPARFTFTEQKE